MTTETSVLERSGPAGMSHVSVADATVAELFARWRQDRDGAAREQLVTRYLPLAKKLARRYRGAREPLDDLEQVASMGLVKAIDRYDPERGTGFQSFAVPTILGELKRYFRDCGWAVHMPRGIQDLANKVEQAQRAVTAKTGRPPTFNELAEYLEIPVEDVLEAVEASAAHHSVSFETPHHNGEGDIGTLGDSIGEVDSRFDMVDFVACIAEATKHLTERERRILALRFLAERTQAQIADEIGLSQMQISRILRKALDNLSAIVEGEQPA
jgi:RNA polymerase sigma-B factor